MPNKKMIAHNILQTIFLIAGIIVLLAALLNWEWFFASRNAAPVVRYFGRTKSRLLYGAAGVFLIAAAIGFYYHIKNTL